MERSSDPLSRVSTAASSGTRASTPSARRCSTSARSLGGVEPHVALAARAAATARSASSAPPRATSAIGCSSIGETSVKAPVDPTRSPPIQCSVETSMPSTTARLVVLPPRDPEARKVVRVRTVWGAGEAVKPTPRVGSPDQDRRGTERVRAGRRRGLRTEGARHGREPAPSVDPRSWRPRPLSSWPDRPAPRWRAAASSRRTARSTWCAPPPSPRTTRASSTTSRRSSSPARARRSARSCRSPASRRRS